MWRLWRLKQEDQDFKISLSRSRPCLKQRNKQHWTWKGNTKPTHSHISIPYYQTIKNLTSNSFSSKYCSHWRGTTSLNPSRKALVCSWTPREKRHSVIKLKIKTAFENRSFIYEVKGQKHSSFSFSKYTPPNICTQACMHAYIWF